MHYKNGREAKNGDKVMSFSNYPNSRPTVGILYDANPAGGNTCNGRLAAIGTSDPVADLSECLHLDDVRQNLGGLVADSSKPVIEDKPQEEDNSDEKTDGPQSDVAAAAGGITQTALE